VYKNNDPVFIGKIYSISNHEVILKIDSNNFGSYAIKGFHDENDNRELTIEISVEKDKDFVFRNLLKNIILILKLNSTSKRLRS